MTTAVRDPGKESRSASGIPVVPAFDGYRAYAILGIVLLHVLSFSGVLARSSGGWFVQLAQGTLGQMVDVLFIISGFVVFLPTVARQGEFGSVKAYGIRRAARLVPAYWLMLGIVLLLLEVVSRNPPVALPSVESVGFHFAFLQTPAAMFDNLPLGFGIDAPVWTLSLEVTFYAILPLVAAWYFRRPLVGLAAAAAITAGWHEALVHYGDVTSFLGVDPSDRTSFRVQTSALSQFPFFAFSFAAGMTAAWAYVRLRERHTEETLLRRASVVQVASLVALAVFAYLIGRKAVGAGVLFGGEAGRRPAILALGYTASLATLMVATALGAYRWQRPFANAGVRRLGDISYGTYLVHLVILSYPVVALSPSTSGGHGGILRLGDGTIGDFVLVAAAVFPLSVLYGYLSARFLEQPIRRWAHRYGRRQREPTVARATSRG